MFGLLLSSFPALQADSQAGPMTLEQELAALRTRDASAAQTAERLLQLEQRAAAREASLQEREAALQAQAGASTAAQEAKV